MTNATKTLAALFVVLLVVAGFMKFSQSSSSSRALLSNVITIDTAKVNKVVIHTPTSKAMKLTKKGGRWSVQQGNGESYPADGNTVEDVINSLNGVKPQSIVTHNPRQFTRYAVDSTGTKVDFDNGNTKLASIYLGRFQMQNQRSAGTYVRPASQNTVYMINGFLTHSFDRHLDEWRQKQVWQYPRSKITQVDMIYPADSSYTFVKGSDSQHWLYGTDTLKPGIVDGMLDHIAQLKVDSFDYNKKSSDLTHPLYSIRLHLKDGQTREIHLTPGVKDNENDFLVTATNYPYVGKVRKSLYLDEVLKPLNVLKMKPKKKKKK
ncbi:MAG TPA: DUF4340 domain-containing protein [Balneolales bacterium]|nr:DUF4340 domain-containing protein [Balneolales bacterium]